MSRSPRLIPVAALLASALLLTGSVPAQEKQTGRVPLPVVKIEKGAHCVEPTDEMRRNHMKFILHQREETMRRGIRTTRHSLKGCIECHANPETRSVVGKNGFCESCHTYAAVRIDCFECHSASPRPTDSAQKPVASLALPVPDRQRIAAAAPSRMCTP